MSSDDESTKPIASTSKSINSTTKPKSKKLSRAEQLANRKGNKAGKKDQKKRKRTEGSDQEEEEEITIASEDETMSADFAFDALGGGFVGDRRLQVWDAGVIDYALPIRPNAIPRVTIDEIIARRAPERDAKVAAKATKKAAAENDDEADELENEMMGALSGDEKEEESDEEKEEAQTQPEKGDVEDIQEDWLRLGEVSEGDEEIEEETIPDIASDDDEDIPTGFAALAELDAELSESEIDADAMPEDLRSPSPATEGAPSASDAAASKAYFTSHSNAKTSETSVSFSTLPGCTLSRQLLLSLASLNLTIPTPIQRECIPVAMLGKDIVASSRTGSGKTVAFWVGVLERLLHRDRRSPTTRVVVMCPTRELAVQVHGVGVALARFTDIQFCLCVGGLSLKVQESELKSRPDIVVSTPGRLIDHVRNTPCFNMDGVEVLVLDEADRMLEEGFKAELEEIITAAPRSRQTLLFSATVTESISQLSRLSMNKPVRVKIDEMGATASGLVQEFLRVRGDKAGEAIERGFRSGERSREALLVALCTRSFSSGRTIIFFRSKAQAHRMKIIFSLHGEGLERSDELHGDLTQEARLTSLRRFREGECAFLLATDLASRGLDIKGIENVINYEMPRSIEIYLHRVGRTARAGRKGRALTLVGESDRKLVKLAMKHAPPETVKQRVIPPEVILEVSTELQELEGEVKAVQREEKEEKEYRRGDMEITKGRNMLEHEREIMSRPARTWFQTTVEKAAAKSAGLAEHNSKFTEKPKRPTFKDREAPEPKAPKRPLFAGLSRKEKRRKMAAEDDKEDNESNTHSKSALNAVIRNAKKANKAVKITQAPTPRAAPLTKKKKAAKNGFEKELGVNGAAEKSARLERARDPDAPVKKSVSVKGGSAGKASKVGGTKRENKASKRS